MKEMAISKFKATCLATLERVRRTGEPVLVTRFGKPVAQIEPPRKVVRGKRPLGKMRGTAEILGDIVSPAFDPSEWDALK